ncbi:hypothetical protein LCGC14_2984060 [marine sediment metagenome]|uniref:Uncharacterized protein n=1 Tax=marine sediment metagenome TaxID=412755 RepID=A0A0F8X5S6_9ZZZZ
MTQRSPPLTRKGILDGEDLGGKEAMRRHRYSHEECWDGTQEEAG